MKRGQRKPQQQKAINHCPYITNRYRASSSPRTPNRKAYITNHHGGSASRSPNTPNAMKPPRPNTQLSANYSRAQASGARGSKRRADIPRGSNKPQGGAHESLSCEHILSPDPFPPGPLLLTFASPLLFLLVTGGKRGKKRVLDLRGLQGKHGSKRKIP